MDTRDKEHEINKAFTDYATRVAFSVTLTKSNMRALRLLLRGYDIDWQDSHFLAAKGLITRTMQGDCTVTRAGKAVGVLLEEAGFMPKLQDHYYDKEGLAA